MGQGLPRVIVSETDLSQYVDTLVKGISCVAGLTERGPVGTPQLISSEIQFERIYGGEIKTSDFPLIAKRALSYGAVLWVSRVAHYENINDKSSLSAKTAYVNLKNRLNEPQDTLKISAASPGEWGNDISVQIYESSLDSLKLFSIRVFYNDEEVENLTDLSVDENDENYFEKAKSSYITISALFAPVSPLDTESYIDSGQSLDLIAYDEMTPYQVKGTLSHGIRPAEGTYSLDGGSDGDGITDADFIGSSTNGTGIHAFDDITDALQLAVPGISSPAVITAGLAYCETRGDLLFVCETPFDLTPQEAVDFRLGRGVYTHAPFVSNYGALYYPKVKIYDVSRNKERLISPVGDVLGVMAVNDYAANESFVPAGIRRGKLLNALGIDVNVGSRGRLGDGNYLCENQINPLCVFEDAGTVVWGAQTLQRQASLLREINVRRMMIIVRKTLSAYARAYIHQPNDPRTWHEFYQGLEPKFEEWKSQRWFYDYRIFCDQNAESLDEAKLNTPESVQRGEFRCRIYVKPVIGIKWILLDAVITRLDEEYSESLTETLGIAA